MRGPILDEWDRITRTLAGMHWSVVVSYENGRPTKVRWHDCGIEQASLCMVPEQTARFEYADDRFLPACGVRPPDMRDGHFTAEVRRFDFERMESSVRRTVFAGSESTGGFECNACLHQLCWSLSANKGDYFRVGKSPKPFLFHCDDDQREVILEASVAEGDYLFLNRGKHFGGVECRVSTPQLKQSSFSKFQFIRVHRFG